MVVCVAIKIAVNKGFGYGFSWLVFLLFGF